MKNFAIFRDECRVCFPRRLKIAHFSILTSKFLRNLNHHKFPYKTLHQPDLHNSKILTKSKRYISNHHIANELHKKYHNFIIIQVEQYSIPVLAYYDYSKSTEGELATKCVLIPPSHFALFGAKRDSYPNNYFFLRFDFTLQSQQTRLPV